MKNFLYLLGKFLRAFFLAVLFPLGGVADAHERLISHFQGRSPHPAVIRWFADLQEGAPLFFSIGEDVYQISGLTRQVGPFLLSCHEGRLRHDDAVVFCRDHGARLPTLQELHVLNDGRPSRVHQTAQDPISSLANKVLWSSDLSPHSGHPRVYAVDDRIFGHVLSWYEASACCVLPVEVL